MEGLDHGGKRREEITVLNALDGIESRMPPDQITPLDGDAQSSVHNSSLERTNL